MQSYTNKPNLSDVNIDCDLELGSFKLKGNIDYSASNDEINLSNRNLLGVNLFSCADFLGAIIASASDAIKKTITFNQSGNATSKGIRIPSNFVAGSNFRISTTGTPQTTSYYDDEVHQTKYIYAGVHVIRSRNGIETSLGDIGANAYLDVTGLQGGDYVKIRTYSNSIDYWSNFGIGVRSTANATSAASNLSVSCDVANYASSGAVW